MLPVAVEWFYRRKPIKVGLTVLALDFGMIMLIRFVIEVNFYFTRWHSFYIGDTLCLPVCAAFAAKVIDHKQVTGWSQKSWWNYGLLLFGCVLSIFLEINANLGGREREITWLPSQLYHTAIFVVMFYIIVWGVVAAWNTRRNANLALFFCMVFLGLYAAAFVSDSIPALQNVEPETMQDRK